MKQIVENWNKFLDEAELGGDATEEPTAAGEVTPPTDQQIGAVEELLKTIIALADAVEDADTETQETAQEIGDQLGEGAGRRNRMARKARQQRTRKIKELAGLTDVKLKDFTPEQRQLYDEAKAEIKQMEDAAEFNFVNTLANGNLLNIPVIKNTIDKGGAPLRLAITAVLAAGGASACVDELSLTCLTTALAGAGQGS
tara:strand:+ start:8327 stop:8923 length:597 start_codon:yes stop_codon:yes gene_type:complete